METLLVSKCTQLICLELLEPTSAGNCAQFVLLQSWRVGCIGGIEFQVLEQTVAEILAKHQSIWSNGSPGKKGPACQDTNVYVRQGAHGPGQGKSPRIMGIREAWVGICHVTL